MLHFFFRLYDIGHMHPLRSLNKRALNRSVNYIENKMSSAVGFKTRKEIITYALNHVEVAGYYLEFGVAAGGTIRYMAKTKPDITFHGFDSFEGLPEDWSGTSFQKASFLQKRLPVVPVNVQLHKGWFKDTIRVWLKANLKKVAFIYVDCDLYASTVDIFNNLASRLQVGTIILFDEYLNHPHWELHEYKAWQEVVERYQIQYEYLAFAHYQVLIKIKDIQL